MGWWKHRAGELRTVGLETVRPFASPFAKLVRTTWAMVRHPVRFGQFVDEDRGGLAGGLAYMAQAVLLLFVVIAVTFRWFVSMDSRIPNFPFIEVVIAGGFVAMSLAIWLAFAPFFRVLAGKQLKLYAFVAANSYWVGLLITFVSLSLLVVAPLVGIFSEPGDGVASHSDEMSLRVGFQWLGWNELTCRQLLFLGCWVAAGLVLVTGALALISAVWGLVCWLSKAHGASRLRVIVAMLVFQACFHSIAFIFG